MSVLHNHAVVHHHDSRGGFEHDAQIMADEDGGEAFLLLQLADRVHHLVLHQHVERGGRLVEHHQLGFEGQCECDRHALSHAAGEFARISVERAFRKSDLADELEGALLPLVFLDMAVGLVDVDEVLANRAHGVEGVHAGLQHHGETALTLDSQLFGRQRCDVLAVEQDPSSCDDRRRRGKAGAWTGVSPGVA